MKTDRKVPFYHPNRIVRRRLQLLFYIHEVNTIKPFLPKETVIMSFMRKCHLSISVVSCPQKLFIQVLGGYSPRQIHLFIYHLRASRQIKPGCIITGKFDLLETLLSHCKHKLTKQNLHLFCVFKNNLTPRVTALISCDDSFNHP